MKKIVCEICGSQKLKKENDVFVCQECGTEYSLEAAKKLLVDIDDNSPSSKEISPKNEPESPAVEEDKKVSIDVLCAWYKLLKALETANETLNIRYPVAKSNQVDLAKINKIQTNPCGPISWLSLKDFDDLNGYDKDKYLTLVSATGYLMNRNIVENDDGRKIYTSYKHYEGTPAKILDDYLNKRITELRYCNCSVSVNERPFGVYSLRFGGRLGDDDFKDLAEIVKTLLGNDLRPGNVSIDGEKSEVVSSCLNQTYEYINYYIEQYAKQYDFIKNDANFMNDTISLLNYIPVFNTMFNLPEEYRQSSIVRSFIEILHSGRADTYQEMVSIFEKEKRTFAANKNTDEPPIDKIDEKLIKKTTSNGEEIIEALKEVKDINDRFNKFLVDYKELQSLPAKQLDRETGQRVYSKEENDEAFNLGLNHYSKKEYSKALTYFKAVADRGYTKAYFYLGYIYDSSTSPNIVKDDNLAIRYYELAADQGQVESLYNIALIYDRGRVVGPIKPIKDPKQAVKYFKMAADKGHAKSQYCLGKCYEEGKGIKQDYKEAAKYYKLAADQGHVDAKNRLDALEKK